MHNRKDGSLVLLAANGGGVLLTAQAFLTAVAKGETAPAWAISGATTVFAMGGLFAYLALRHSADLEASPQFRWYERFAIASFALPILVLFAFAVPIS